MAYIKDLINIPDHVGRGDFVLRLSEGITDPEGTVQHYQVTPQLVECFDQALNLVKSAIQGGTGRGTSKAAYLHGSFGSGKSHFMAILYLILAGNSHARTDSGTGHGDRQAQRLDGGEEVSDGALPPDECQESGVGDSWWVCGLHGPDASGRPDSSGVPRRGASEERRTTSGEHGRRKVLRDAQQGQGRVVVAGATSAPHGMRRPIRKRSNRRRTRRLAADSCGISWTPTSRR